jgi:hypothetical protein
MRNSVAASVVLVVAMLAIGTTAARPQTRISGEGFISEGIPKMPNPPGPAPKRDLSGTWVGPGTSNKPDPAPP